MHYSFFGETGLSIVKAGFTILAFVVLADNAMAVSSLF